LFGNKQDQKDRTEIVLSITPHILRGLKRPDIQHTEFWSGTEANLHVRAMPQQSTVKSGPESANTSDSSNQSGQSNQSSVFTNATQPEIPAKNVLLSWDGPAKVKAGEEFKLALKVKADGSIRSLPLQLGYDPQMLQVTDIEEGTFFGQNNGKTSFSKNIDAANGKAFVSVARSDVNGANGEGVAMYIKARALTDVSASAVKVLQASAITQSGVQPTVSIPAAWGAAASQ
jgi:general secretion pathway protein D